MAERKLRPGELGSRLEKIIKKETRGFSPLKKEIIQDALAAGVVKAGKKLQYGVSEKYADKIIAFPGTKKYAGRHEYKQVLKTDRQREALGNIVNTFYGRKPEAAKPKEEVKKEVPKKVVQPVHQELKHEPVIHRSPSYTPTPHVSPPPPTLPAENHEPFHNPLPPEHLPPPPMQDGGFGREPGI